MNSFIREKIRDEALALGFTRAEYIEQDKIVFYPELRAICEGTQCGCYDANWVCPPAFGSFEDGKKKILSYKNFLLFSKKYELEDRFDFEGMQQGMRDFRRSIPGLERAAREALLSSDTEGRDAAEERTLEQKADSIPVQEEDPIFILSAGSCGLCKNCTYPDAPCRFPQLLHHPIEGYGLNVNELAQSCGMAYNNGPATVTYFGGILF